MASEQVSAGTHTRRGVTRLLEELAGGWAVVEHPTGETGACTPVPVTYRRVLRQASFS